MRIPARPNAAHASTLAVATNRLAAAKPVQPRQATDATKTLDPSAAYNVSVAWCSMYEENGIYKQGDPAPQFYLQESADGTLIGLYAPSTVASTWVGQLTGGDDAAKKTGVCVPEFFEAALPLSAVANTTGPDGGVIRKPYIQLKQAYWSASTQRTVVAGGLWDLAQPIPQAALQDGFKVSTFNYLTNTSAPVDVVSKYILNAPDQTIEHYFLDRKTNAIFDIEAGVFGSEPSDGGSRTFVQNFTALQKPAIYWGTLSYAAPTLSPAAPPYQPPTPTVTVIANAVDVNKTMDFAGVGTQAGGPSPYGSPIAFFTGGVFALAMVGYAAKAAFNIAARAQQRARAPQPSPAGHAAPAPGALRE